MKSPRSFIFLIALLCAPALPAAPLQRSISSSRQFIIYGPNLPLRGAMGDLAERTKDSLLGILQKHDDWKTPIILNVQFQQANAPDVPASLLHVSQTGGGLKLQLDLTIPAHVDRLVIQRDLLRAIFIELIYRNRPETPAGTTYTEAPSWMIEGILVRCSDERMQTFTTLLAAASGANRTISLSDFLGQKPLQLDSQGRLIYRAYSAALVSMLVESSEGRAHLRRFVSDLSQTANDPLAENSVRPDKTAVSLIIETKIRSVDD